MKAFVLAILLIAGPFLLRRLFRLARDAAARAWCRRFKARTLTRGWEITARILQKSGFACCALIAVAFLLLLSDVHAPVVDTGTLLYAGFVGVFVSVLALLAFGLVLGPILQAIEAAAYRIEQ